jgi:hypothetical protein
MNVETTKFIYQAGGDLAGCATTKIIAQATEDRTGTLEFLLGLDPGTVDAWSE